MARYFIDFEFIEDGKTIDLVSVGVVCEDGRELYLESSEFDESKANDFVRKEVLPKLGDKALRVTKSEIRSKLLSFVGEDIPTWVGYYPSYDFVCLCQIFGTMSEQPKGWPKMCFDLKQEVLKIGNPKLPNQDQKGGHNSLSDAKWTKDAYIWLRTNHGVNFPLTVVQKTESAPKFNPLRFYQQIKELHEGKAIALESIGDNTVDNLLDNLKRATAVEIGQFVASLLNKEVGAFEYAYSVPQFDKFRDALVQTVERFRIMDGLEQGDLFSKITNMFKDIFMDDYSDLGPETAELIATRYAKQMIDFLKASSVQKADLSVSTQDKIY